ncbi:hypothetical protein LSCM1_06771 [Leishmania martiniquensis]|uniref:Ttaggg binding factor n=1 Tax=Leishmania martiniquensis TaxID=1580590 RepID=A0A836GFL9_9TRYP|nr:hypothetical protein LSCM1_06771 [Leishmania martiniquensis]
MPAAGSSTAAATLVSGSGATAAGGRQREPQHSIVTDNATTVARGDDSDRLLTNAKEDVHYFDVVHPILLSHVRRANSEGVLALLSLPIIAESAIFWRTCTYCEGLVAAVLIHVMEHTGQVTVPASPPALGAASPPGGPMTFDSRADDSQVCSSRPTPQTGRRSPLLSLSLHSSPATAAPPNADSVAVDRLSPMSPSPPITPLTVADLYSLLHLCRREWAVTMSFHEAHQGALSSLERTDTDIAEGPCRLDRCRPPALASLLRLGRALLRRDRRQPQPAGALRQATGDMELYVQSVMRRLEAMMDAQTEMERGKLDAPSRTLRKRSRSSDAPTALPTSACNQGKRTEILTSSGPDSLRAACEGMRAAVPADVVDLAALAAVLQEHCHEMVYVSPFNDPRLAAAAAVEESTDSSATTATTIMGISSSNSNGSLTNAVHAVGVATTANITAGVSAADLVEAAPEVLSKGVEGAHEDATEDSNAQDLVGGLDAVALLRRIPAISATRWSLPSGARNATSSGASDSGGEAQSLPSAVAGTATARRSGGRQRHPASADASVSANVSMRPVAGSLPCMPAAVRRTPADDEQARVSAAIRAFDAFTAALEQSAPTTVDVSVGLPQPSPVPSPSLSTGNLSRSRVAARPVTPGALRSRPLAPPPPLSRPLTSEVRRRHKFSPQEDAAILHGVARFGQMSGSFQYILHAYRNVWRTGRTALHLYDHWRGALRRRAVAAAGSGATSDADKRALQKAPDDEEGAMSVSPIRPATSDYEQDLSSDIEGFSDDS